MRGFLVLTALAWHVFAIPAAQPPQEGFIDEDTYVGTGVGQSSKGAKSHQSAESLAKEAARVDAMQKLVPVLKRDEPACGNSGDNDNSKDLQGMLRSHKLLHAQCSLLSDDPPAQECKVWIQIRMKGLRRIIESSEGKPGRVGDCRQ